MPNVLTTDNLLEMRAAGLSYNRMEKKLVTGPTKFGAAFLYLANKVKFAASAPLSLILAFVEFPSDIRDAQDDL